VYNAWTARRAPHAPVIHPIADRRGQAPSPALAYATDSAATHPAHKAENIRSSSLGNRGTSVS
jgi:hypothetical protein